MASNKWEKLSDTGLKDCTNINYCIYPERKDVEKWIVTLQEAANDSNFELSRTGHHGEKHRRYSDIKATAQLLGRARIEEREENGQIAEVRVTILDAAYCGRDDIRITRKVGTYDPPEEDEEIGEDIFDDMDAYGLWD